MLIIIPTYNAEPYLQEIINKLEKHHPDILIVDSNSIDNTISIAKSNNINIIKIGQHSFNHGATREKYRKSTTSDIVVYFTQDAIPVEPNIIEKLTKPLIEGKASVSYGRQIPRSGANILEAFPRMFNYGNDPQIRSINDVDRYGVHTFFCSNSCAAYLNKDLDEIGGFKPTLTNEDYFAVAELLINGKKIAYVPNAQVIHSHSYTLKDEFKRYFDTGYVRAERPWVQELVGDAEKMGKKYFSELTKSIFNKNIILLPYAISQTIVKFLGFKFGYNALKFPNWIKKIMSGQKYYWDSPYNLNRNKDTPL
jgi:rhamnosyltransferase